MTATACPTCTANLAADLRELAESARQALIMPSAVRLARLNSAQASMAATLHNAWACDRCQDLGQATELPLFPDLH